MVKSKQEQQPVDEEQGLINHKKTISIVKQNANHRLGLNKLRFRIEKMKRPEILLILIAALLTLTWFEIICIVKHQHDTNYKLNVANKASEKGVFLQKTLTSDVKEDTELSSQILDKKQKRHQHHHKEQKKNKQDHASEDKLDWEHLEIVKSDVDDKEYKLYKLLNGIKVLLVSDSSISQSHSILDVLVGSWTDPIPGLSHFLEHMKFQTTNDHGMQPGDLDNLISCNQGSSNAETDSENTNYNFEVSPNALEKSLKIFSDMFKNVTFKRESVMNEINAVNSEFVNSLSSDGWKSQYLLQLLAKKGHPAQKFGCGSTETLSDVGKSFDILEELQKYDRSHYSSNIMSLLILSNQSIKELESFVESAHFDEIPNLKKERKYVQELPLDSNSLGRIYQIKTDNTEFKELQIFHQILKSTLNNRLDYMNYFQEVMVGPSQRSLQSQLKQNNLVNLLQFGLFQEVHSFSVYEVIINLTDIGYEKIDQVLQSYFTFVQQFQEDFDQDNFQKKGAFEKILFKYDPNDKMDGEELIKIGVKLNSLDNPSQIFIQNLYKPFSMSQFNNIFDIIKDPMKSLIIIKSNSFDSSPQSQIIEHLDNQFKYTNTQFGLFYNIVATLTQKNINYLTSKEPTDEPLSFLVTIPLDFAPTEDIQFYDLTKVDSQAITDQIYLPSLSQNHSFDPSSPAYELNPYANSTGVERFYFSEESWNDKLESSMEIKYFPTLLVENQQIKSFLMVDFEKNQPRQLYRLRLFNKQAKVLSKEETILLELFKYAQTLNLQNTFAEEIESDYSFLVSSSNDNGKIYPTYFQLYYFQYVDVMLQFSGWPDKFTEINKKFIQTVQQYVPQEEDWNQSKNGLIQQIQDKMQSWNLVKKFIQTDVSSFIDPQSIHSDEKIEMITNAQLSNWDEFTSKILHPSNIDLIFTGNISPSEVISQTESISSLFSLSKDESQPKFFNIVDFTGKNYVFQTKAVNLQIRKANNDEDDLNSVTVNVYQIGIRSVENLIYIRMLEDIMNRFFFQSLRTEKTLGYIANSQILTFGCVDHIAVYLQGFKKQPNEINRIIEEEFIKLGQEINQLSDEKFKDSVKSFRTQYEKLPPSLLKKLDLVYAQISREMYAFDIDFYILNAIDNRISLEGFKAFFFKYFHDQASKISFQQYSQKHPFDSTDLQVNPFAENLKKVKPILIKSKEHLYEANENLYHECHYVL